MEIITSLLSDLGVDTGMGLLAFLMIVLAAVGRAIPDNATGALGFVRKLVKLVALKGNDRKDSGDKL